MGIPSGGHIAENGKTSKQNLEGKRGHPKQNGLLYFARFLYLPGICCAICYYGVWAPKIRYGWEHSRKWTRNQTNLAPSNTLIEFPAINGVKILLRRAGMCPTLMQQLTLNSRFSRVLGSYTNGMSCVLDVVRVGISVRRVVKLGT